MGALLRRILQRLREEPALIGSGVSVAVTVGAAFGLEITDEQRDALLMLAGFIGAAGVGIRSQVKPMAKVKREEGQRNRPAELDPRLLSGERKGRR